MDIRVTTTDTVLLDGVILVITPSEAAESQHLHRLVFEASRLMPTVKRPRIFMPHDSDEVLLSFRAGTDPGQAAYMFSEAIRQVGAQ